MTSSYQSGRKRSTPSCLSDKRQPSEQRSCKEPEAYKEWVEKENLRTEQTSGGKRARGAKYEHRNRRQPRVGQKRRSKPHTGLQKRIPSIRRGDLWELQKILDEKQGTLKKIRKSQKETNDKVRGLNRPTETALNTLAILRVWIKSLTSFFEMKVTCHFLLEFGLDVEVVSNEGVLCSPSSHLHRLQLGVRKYRAACKQTRPLPHISQGRPLNDNENE